jgi:hypothetical protein
MRAALAARDVWNRLWARLGAPPADLPAAPAAQERLGRLLGIFSVAWIVLVGCWGITGLFPDGHFASSAAIGTAAANMWRLHTIYPVPAIVNHPLSPSDYYMHHPVGLFWVAAAFIKVLGESNWAIRLPAILVAGFTPFLLYRTARALYGPVEAGLAALAYVALPITMAYANYVDLEGPVTLGCVMATWGYVRLVQTSRARYTWPCALGVAYALIHDWESGIWLGSMLGLAFAWAYAWPGRRERLDYRVFGRAWSLMMLAGILPLVISIGLVLSSGRLEDLLGSYGQRTTGNQAPLSLVLEQRHVRIELMFTPIAIAMGKLAVLAILLRFAFTRDHLDLVPLPLLLMATVYYVLFKNGADTHIFWPRPFSGYLPLAAASLAASLRQGGAWLVERVARRGWPPNLRLTPARARAAVPWVATALVGVPLLLVLRDGASLLRLGRESGGRFMEANLESAIEETEALRWFLARYPANEPIGFHVPLYVPWSVQWEIRPRAYQGHQYVGAVPPAGTKLLFLNTRVSPAADLKEAATKFHVLAVDNFWFMDRSKPAAPLDGFRIDERQPGPIDWYLKGGVEPIRTIVPDPYVTWEMRTAVGQKATRPAEEPKGMDQLRIAHNIAASEGRPADQAKLRERLLSLVNLPVHATYSNGTKLLGVIHHRGAERSLTLLFEAGQFTSQTKFVVHAKVTRRRFLSTLPVDPADLDTALPPSIPTPLWIKGHIYAVKAVYHHRAGHERFYGAFAGGVANRTDGSPNVDLLDL